MNTLLRSFQIPCHAVLGATVSPTSQPATGNRKPETSRRGRAAFTLIELLVVVAVMGVLLALLGGGIRKSLDNAKKRGRETEVASLAAAIENYHTDTGKYPITIKSGQYTYTYKENNDEVFTYLLNPSKNALGKRYLDMNGLRTAKNGRVKRLESDSEPLADYTGAYYKVTFDLKTKSVKVE